MPAICRSAAFPLLALLATALPAQLSGTYSIGPSGGRDYGSITAASFDLLTKGVKGPVVFELESRTFVEQVQILAIPGSSTTNTITFRSTSQGPVTLSSNGGQAPILETQTLAGLVPGHLRFIGLSFRGGATVQGFVGLEGDDIKVVDCEFASARLVLEGDGQSLEGCRFGPKSKLVFGGAGGVVNENHFDGVNNVIAGSLGTSGRTRVYNNVFSGRVGTLARLQDGLDFVHNTVVTRQRTSGSGSNPHASVKVTSRFGHYPELRNNIISNLDGGKLLDVIGVINSFYVRSDHNLFHAPSSPTLFSTGPFPIQTLASWRSTTGLDAGSRQGDPGFVDVDAGPLGLRVSGISPALGAAVGTPSYVATDFAGLPRRRPATLGALRGPSKSSFVLFARGCAGSGGKIPLIEATGAVAIGSKDFRVGLRNAYGGGSVRAFLALGPKPIKLNLGGSCDLLVNPLVLLQTGVQGTGAGNGTAGFKLPIPNNPALQGRTLRFQWGVVDPAAPGLGIATSAGAVLAL